MKHAKVYMLMGGEMYEKDYCFGVYANKENAEKALKRRENSQFYDPLGHYQSDISYYIREKEIKDCKYVEKENFPIFEISIERSITFVIDKEITKNIMYAK